MPTKNNDIFDDENEVQSNWVKFSEVGDMVHGTLISVRSVKSNLPGKEGEMQTIYELKADGGSFHAIDENKQIIKPPIEIQEEEYWNVGGNFALDQQLRNTKVGTKIGIKFTGEKPPKTKGFNPTKIKKVYIQKDTKTNQPLMDQEWLDIQETINNVEEMMT